MNPDDRRLDRDIEYYLMGSRRAGNDNFWRAHQSDEDRPHPADMYSYNLEHTARMEARLQELGLHEVYAVALARRVGYDRSPATAFRLITATARDRCEAALSVMPRTDARPPQGEDKRDADKDR